MFMCMCMCMYVYVHVYVCVCVCVCMCMCVHGVCVGLIVSHVVGIISWKSLLQTLSCHSSMVILSAKQKEAAFVFFSTSFQKPRVSCCFDFRKIKSFCICVEVECS